jgi:hypothetical protein
MDSDAFFLELNAISTISDVLLDMARSAPESKWETHLDQNLILVPKELLRSEPSLATFMDQYDPGRRMMIFRTQPHAAYSWHMDKNRKSAINMLLHGPDSITFAGKRAPIGTTINLNSMLELYRLPLRKNKYYLFNVGGMHAVYNYGDQIRYLLSISVPFPYTYEQTAEFVKTNNL